MSVTTQIMFMIIGTVLTAVALFSEEIKKKISAFWFKTIVGGLFIIFITVGIWDILTRDNDSKGTSSQIVSKVQDAAAAVNSKVDAAKDQLSEKSDSTTEVLIKEIPKKIKIPKLPKVAQKGDNYGTEGNNNKNVFNGGKDNEYKAPVHVGDINSEKQMTEQEMHGILNDIEYHMKTHKLKNCVYLMMHQASNGGKFYTQLRQLLIDFGYKIEGEGVSFGSPFKGLSANAANGCLTISVGTF